MECPKCSAVNPDGKRFCGECGGTLDLVAEEFRRNVKAIFRQELRDQKLVEVETADAVINRLKLWFKPAAYMGAIALTLVGFLGFKGLQDLSAALAKAQKEAVEQLRTQAVGEAKQLSQEAAALRAQYRKVGDTRELDDKLKQADAKVKLAEAQVLAITRAARSVRERYDRLGTEVASRESQPANTAAVARPSGAVSMMRGGSATEPGETVASVYAQGSKGPEVARIQTRLRELGCYSGQPQGEFDTATKTAVTRFNEARGDIFGPGFVDAATWDALFDTKSPRCR